MHKLTLLFHGASVAWGLVSSLRQNTKVGLTLSGVLCWEGCRLQAREHGWLFHKVQPPLPWAVHSRADGSRVCRQNLLLRQLKFYHDVSKWVWLKVTLASLAGVVSVICCATGMVEFCWGRSYGIDLNNCSKACSRDVSESWAENLAQSALSRPLYQPLLHEY